MEGDPRRLLYFSREYTTHDRRFLEALSEMTYPGGGAGSRERRWEIHFLQLERDGIPYESRPLPDGVERVLWPCPDGLREVPLAPGESLGLSRDEDGVRRVNDMYREIVAQLRPTVVQAGPIQSCARLAVAGRAPASSWEGDGVGGASPQGAPVLAVSWGSDILVHAHRNDASRAATREALGGASAFLCDCRAVLDNAREFAPIPEERVVMFPWGIDLSAFPPPGKEPEEEPGEGLELSAGGGSGFEPGGATVPEDWRGRRVVLSTRAWESLHGVETLLEAFALAHAADPELRLILGSTGSRKAWVEEFLAERGLQEVVHAPGQLSQEEIPGLFRSAHVYVSCAHSDGTSISLLEALATGLPVVVTDIPSNEEWVAPDRAWGWLAPAGDARGVAEALHAAFQLTPEERREVARRNRRVAAERAEWYRNVEALKSMLNRLVEGG